MTVPGSSPFADGPDGGPARGPAIIEREGTSRDPAPPTEPHADHEHAKAFPAGSIPPLPQPNPPADSPGGGARPHADAGGRGTTAGVGWAGTDRATVDGAGDPIVGTVPRAGRPRAGRRGPPAPAQRPARPVARARRRRRLRRRHPRGGGPLPALAGAGADRHRRRPDPSGPRHRPDRRARRPRPRGRQRPGPPQAAARPARRAAVRHGEGVGHRRRQDRRDPLGRSRGRAAGDGQHDQDDDRPGRPPPRSSADPGAARRDGDLLRAGRPDARLDLGRPRRRAAAGPRAALRPAAPLGQRRGRGVRRALRRPPGRRRPTPPSEADPLPGSSPR